MKRVHLKRRLKCKKMYNLSNKLLFVIIFAIVLSIHIYIYDKHLSPLLLNFAENKVQQLGSSLITKSLNEKLLTNMKENLFIITREKEKIKSIDFNTMVINRIVIDALTITRDVLSTEISYKVPIGSLLNNSFFNNKGPKVKFSFSLANDLSANLNNKITPYGINNAIIETTLNIDLVYKIIIPMSSKSIKSHLSIPMSIKIIEGEVPEYYLNGYNENSKLITLP